MKKLGASILIVLLVSLLYSIDVQVESVVDVQGLTNDSSSKISYFKDVLFYKSGAPKYLTKEGFKHVFPEKVEIDGYGKIEIFKEIIDPHKLLYYCFDMATANVLWGYEILGVKDDKIEFLVLDENQVENYHKKESKSFDFSRRSDFSLTLEFDKRLKLHYSFDYDPDTSKKPSQLFLERDGELFFDFITAYQPYVFKTVAVNDKVNRVAVLYTHPSNSERFTYKNQNNKMVIFALIFNGVLNDSRVRLRTEPNLNSETLTYLTKGDTVKIIDRSTEMQKIGEDEAYWYKVEFEGYPDGWVYGKYVDVE